MRIAINTPNGNIGRALANYLLDAGQELVLLTRSPEKTKPLAERGAQVCEGTLDDQTFVLEATKGVDALFWLMPANYAATDFRGEQTKMGRIAMTVVSENRIPRIMTLSSAGAHLAAGTGPILGLHDLEKMMDKTAASITHLRPNYFMENFLQSLPTIASDGTIYLPIPGSTTFPMIATADIAKVAADRLLDENWEKHTVIELAGPEKVSHDAAAAAIGAVLGKEVKHVQVDEAAFRGAMAQFGVSDSAADCFLEMYDGFANGTIVHETSPLTTTTTLETFAANVMKPMLARMV
jgi:uncharacterized protein YbjT (DUF2867 family)